MKKKWLLIISLIFSIILTATTVVFAWFTVIEKTQPILIYSGSVRQTSNLYEISNGDVEIISSYQFNEVVPGDSFKFRLDITNEGTLDAEIKIVIKFNNNNPALLPYFTLSYGSTNITLNNIFPINGHEFNIGSPIISGQNADLTYNSISLYCDILVDQTLSRAEITNDNNFVEISSFEITLTQVGGN